METVGTNKLVHLEQGEPPCHCEGEERVQFPQECRQLAFLTGHWELIFGLLSDEQMTDDHFPY